MSASASIQRPLPLNIGPRLRGPLVTIPMASQSLGLSVDEVNDLTLLGDLAWTWNVASRDTGRAEKRIFAQCIMGYETTRQKCNLAHWTLKRVIDEILKRDVKPFIYAERLAWLFSLAGTTHIYDLIDDGDLKAVGKWSRGPGCGANITRDSIVSFLNKRRIS